MNEQQENVIVEVTPLFYSREALTKAATFCNGDKGTIVFAWSRVELERGQSAEVKTKTTIKQNKVTLDARFVNTAGFHGMERAGMIKILPGENAKPVMTDEQFETFWNRMPYRTVSGKKTRGIKSNAKRVFHNVIRKQEQFDNLLAACDEYATVSNGFPKDAERFLRIYQDFIPTAGTSIAKPSSAPTIEDKQRIQQRRQEDILKLEERAAQ